MLKRDVEITAVLDGEVSAAALLVQKAGEFKSSVYFEQGAKRVNGKSIMGMMTMPFVVGEVFTISAEGPDEEQAIKALESFLNKK